MSLPIQLDIEGMTSASCATRVEKALNKVEGVEASVNYATERATVLGDVPPETLLGAIESVVTTPTFTRKNPLRVLTPWCRSETASSFLPS